MTDRINCFDLWTVRRLNSDNLKGKGWKEEADWCPFEFSYAEELDRIGTFKFEEEVYEETVEVSDAGEMVATSYRHHSHDVERFISDDGSEEVTTSFESYSYVETRLNSTGGSEEGLSDPDSQGEDLPKITDGNDQKDDFTDEALGSGSADGDEAMAQPESMGDDVQEESDHQSTQDDQFESEE